VKSHLKGTEDRREEAVMTLGPEVVGGSHQQEEFHQGDKLTSNQNISPNNREYFTNQGVYKSH
jgi:hypothetical protein